MPVKNRASVMAFLVFMLFFFNAAVPVDVLGNENGHIPTVEKVKPAGVLVQTNYSAQASIPFPTVPPEKQSIIKNAVISMMMNGSISLNRQAAVNAAISIFLGDPLAYLAPGKTVKTEKVGFSTMGSGLIVSQDGYIVTAAHIAQPSDDSLRSQMLAQAAQIFIDKESKAIRAAMPGGASISDDELQDILTQYVQKYATIDKVQNQTCAAFGPVLPGKAPADQGMPCTVCARGGDWPDRDVAVIKLPQSVSFSLSLGDGTGLNPGAAINILAYPSPLSSAANQEPILIPGSLGPVSLQKDWNACEIITPNPPGDGGIVLDSSGNVIGLTVNIDTDSGRKIVMVPASEIKPFLDRLGVRAQESSAERLYSDAMVQYDHQYYRKALNTLQEIAGTTPPNPYVEDFIARAQLEISAGNDKTLLWEVYPAQITAGAVILLAFGVYLCLRTRAKHQEIGVLDENAESVKE